MLSLKNIDKSFSGVQVLFNISADINEKEVTAIIGENGAGKSTLMNIISGSIEDYSGNIYSGGKQLKFRSIKEAQEKGITIIHQELNILPDLTAGENIFLGKEPLTRGFINYNLMYKDAGQILQKFRFPYPSDIKMRKLSVGWQQIVEIARALTMQAKIIIMDEPTSALSDNETEILFEQIRYLKSEGKTILFISHRISEVLDISDSIIVLRDGRVSAELRTRDTNREELIRYMAGEKKTHFYQNRLSEHSEIHLEVENLSVKSGAVELTGVNFNLQKGEILGIAGLLGSGRTELLKFLFGESGKHYKGNIIYLGKKYIPSSSSDSIKRGIVYLPENRKEEGIFADHSLQFNGGISVLKNFIRGGVLSFTKERESVESKFNELNIKRRNLSQVIRTLSGGNQQKVLLSRILLTDPRLILMDDPTRGIDIGAKEEIYELISSITAKGISVIFTSSEVPELLRICKRILVLSKGNQTALVDAKGKDTQDILKYAFKKL